MGLKARIHRGAAQVGGTCVEVEAEGQRILLDLGMPLDAEEGEVPLPAVPGLTGGDPTLLGILVSHLHGDHCGLVPYAAPRVPMAMGPVASRILREAEFFTGRVPLPEPRWPLIDRQPFHIGPFRITPYKVEHSAFDAFALLIEAGGRRLFYTGDFRAHGNDGSPFDRLLTEPPSDVHAMLMEGTQIGDGREGDGPTEAMLRSALARRFRQWPGLVLASWSSQNLDRLRTVYEASQEAGRALVVDLYTATLARAAGLSGVPALGEDGLRVYLRKNESRAVLESQDFGRSEAVKRARLYPENFAERGRELVVMFRPSALPQFEGAGALMGALAIWSLWSGYLANPLEQRMLRVFAEQGVILEKHHVSGHAYVQDLRRLSEAVKPGRVIPIHTESPERYGELFRQVELKPDGEWWDV